VDYFQKCLPVAVPGFTATGIVHDLHMFPFNSVPTVTGLETIYRKQITEGKLSEETNIINRMLKRFLSFIGSGFGGKNFFFYTIFTHKA
jgi:hypothetical protein